MTCDSISKMRQAALTMAVELAKTSKNGDMDVTAKAQELYNYMDKGVVVMRASSSSESKGK